MMLIDRCLYIILSVLGLCDSGSGAIRKWEMPYLDGVDVLMRLEAKFFIMDINESALEIFCNLCMCLPVTPALEFPVPLCEVFKADNGCKVRPEAALLDSMDSILDSYKSSEPDV